MENKGQERQSGIELLKLTAMLVIVLSHVIQSIGQRSADYPIYNSMIIDLTEVTKNPQHVIMALLWSMVMWGVNVFFVASAWFLCKREKPDFRKPLQLAADVWVVSVIFLAVYLISGMPVSGKLTVKSLFPNIFSNNWFITCYLLVYLLHPVLNTICEHIDRKTHLITVIAGLIYCVITTVSEDLLFYSKLIVAVIVYLTVVYVRKYESERADKPGLNRTVFTVCLILDVFIILMINVLGQRIGMLEHELMHMQRLENPLLIIMAITSFNLFRNIDMHSGVINHLSALTLYLYIIHENILFRTYTRPVIWSGLINRYGDDHVLICALCYAVVLFLAALAVSEIYFRTLHKAVVKAVEAAAKRFLP